MIKILKKHFEKMTKLEIPDIKRGMNESYIHATNSLVSEDIRIDSIYDHNEYVECSHKISIHSDQGEIEEPSKEMLFTLTLVCITSLTIIKDFI